MESSDPSLPGRPPHRTVRLGELTSTELRDLVEAGPVLGLLPIGAVEAHGPHLPLETDRILAEAMADAGARELGRRGATALVLPSFVWTSAPFARALPGTLDVRDRSVGALLEDVVASCRRWGFHALVLCNAHQDPTHVAVLREIERGADRDFPVVFPDLTRRRWAERLNEDFRRGCHGGRWETSLVSACRPAAVREAVARSLEPRDVVLVEAIRAGARSFAEAGAPEGWLGDPATADRETGEGQIRSLGSIVADAVADAVGGEQR